MKKVFSYLMAMVACLILVGGMVACENSPSDRENTPAAFNSGGDDNGDGDIGPTYPVTLTISGIPETSGIQPAMVTPGVPPDEIWLYGTAINRVNYTPASAVDYSSQVVGGNLSVTFELPIETNLNLGYSLANYLRADNISLNSTPIDAYVTLGTAPNEFPVACFIIHRDENAVVTIDANTVLCDEQAYQMRLRYTGDDDGDGVFDMPYDDTLVALNGTKPGEDYRLQMSYWLNLMPGGVWQQMVWEAAANAYTETIPFILEGQDGWITLYNPARAPECQLPGAVCNYEVSLGGFFADVTPLGGGVTRTSQLVNYVDHSPGTLYWTGPLIGGINPTTGYLIQGPDTRGEFVGGP